MRGSNMALQAGARLGPYEVVSLIGVGGMGEVWLASELRLGRKVALKLLPADLTRDADRIQHESGGAPTHTSTRSARRSSQPCTWR
jgi:serine/threonine protein kinase